MLACNEESMKRLTALPKINRIKKLVWIRMHFKTSYEFTRHGILNLGSNAGKFFASVTFLTENTATFPYSILVISKQIGVISRHPKLMDNLETK